MSQRFLLAVAIALGALVLGLALFWNPGQSPAPSAPSVPAGGDFTLQSAHGPVSLKDYRGRVVLLTFGYTSCPDICPTSLAATAEALKLLTPEEARRVAVLFISVDPERDTPARLKEYVAFFHPGLLGVTGSPTEVAEVAGRYGVYYARHQGGTAAGYVVDHNSDNYLIGPDGGLKGRIPHAAAPELTVAEIRKHLDSK
jgi:protein SCO1/2